jgi:DNA-binding response OmpR family regulator
MDKKHILVVEDDREISDGICIYLKNQGYETFQAMDGFEGLEVIEKERIDLAIVDVMMPRMDGITMTMKVRQMQNFPIIMLTAKSEEIDKVTGLNIGADDYVTKPFAPMELLARVNSQLRRYEMFQRMLQDATQQNPKERVYRVGGLEVNEDTVQVFVDGVETKLTPREFQILLLLIRHPGRVFSTDEIYERIWNEKAVGTDTIMVHIRNIREKIEINPKDPKYLKVVWGIGYKIEKQ